jgi:hypothetical protein
VGQDDRHNPQQKYDPFFVIDPSTLHIRYNWNKLTFQGRHEAGAEGI